MFYIFLYAHSLPTPLHWKFWAMLHSKVNNRIFSLSDFNLWIRSWLSLQRFYLSWPPSLFVTRPWVAYIVSLIVPLYFYFNSHFLVIPLTDLPPPHFCSCLKPVPGVPKSYVVLWRVWRYQRISINRRRDNTMAKRKRTKWQT